MNIFCKRRSLIIVIAVAIIVRLLFGMAFVANGYNGILDDSPGYIDFATSLAEGKNFVEADNGSRTPGYPMVVALCMRLFGSNYLYGTFLLQNLLNIFSVVIAFEMVRLLTKNEVPAFMAGLFTAINIHDVYFNFIIMTDSVCQFATFLSLYFFVRLILDLKNNRSIGFDLVVASLAMAYGVSCRPAQMFLPFCLAIGSFIAALIYKQPKKAFAMLITISLTSLAVILLWSYRNYLSENEFLFSDISIHNMYYYNSVVVYAKQNNLPYYKAFETFFHGKDPALPEYLAKYPFFDAIKHRSMDLILSDIPYYLACCAKNVLYFFFYPGVMDWPAFNSSILDVVTLFKENGFTALIFNYLKDIKHLVPLIIIGINELVLLVFFATSIVGQIKLFKKNWIIALLVLGVILYNVAVSVQPVTIGSYPRFRLTVSLLLVMLTSLCFDTEIDNL